MRQEFLLSDVFVDLTETELDDLSYATETYRITLPGIANIGTSLLSISEMKPVTLRNRMADRAIETMNSFPTGFYRHYRNQIPDRNVDPDGFKAGMGIKDLTLPCFPTLTFANAAVFKGCFTKRHKLYAKILDGEASVIMWRIGSSDHKFYLASLAWSALWDEHFDSRPWIVVLLRDTIPGKIYPPRDPGQVDFCTAVSSCSTSKAETSART